MKNLNLSELQKIKTKLECIAINLEKIKSPKAREAYSSIMDCVYKSCTIIQSENNQ